MFKMIDIFIYCRFKLFNMKNLFGFALFFIMTLQGCDFLIEKKTEFNIDEVKKVDGVMIEKSTNQPVTGVVRKNDKNGSNNFKIKFLNGLLHGTSYFYHEHFSAFSDVKREENYSYGKPHGKLKEFFENGTLKLLMNFENGELEGRVISYTEYGLPDEVVHYNKGKLHGSLRKLYLKNDCSCQYWKTENYSNGNLINYYKYEFYDTETSLHGFGGKIKRIKNDIYIKRIDENGEETRIVLNKEQFNKYKEFPQKTQEDYNGDREEYLENLFN